MKKYYKSSLSVAIFFALATLVGCATVTQMVVYDVISEGEILPALTKITETADSDTPFGGDDGGPLFYAYSTDNGSHYDIYKKDKPLSGSTIQMTSLGTTGFAWFPTYNKTVDKIAFCYGWDIYTMPATKGKALTQLTSTTDSRDNHPCFSPDGNLILFDRIKRTQGSDGQFHYYASNSEIWVKNLQTGENTLLGQGYNPVYSSDGKKIVYVKYQTSQSQIWIMDSDGENPSKLTDNNTLQWAYRPQFSPDGKYIVFAGKKKVESDNSSDLYIVPSDGGDLTRLTISKASDYNPYWSNEGYIYFVSDRGGKKGDFNIWRFKYSAE